MITGNEILFRKINENNILYAVLDYEKNNLEILVDKDSRKRLLCLLVDDGFHKTKKRNHDIYLYGMDVFEYYQKSDLQFTICYQLACRSTLHGEWVPLDRIVNTTALNSAVKDSNEISILNPIDAICYLLAKSVYTEGCFSSEKVYKISELYKSIDKSYLYKKLNLIFFNYTPHMIQHIENNDYDNIISDFWSYGEY